MHNIYKLLRNNQQTGPYTLDELVQLQLKPFDLIWVEGRSAGWMYPTEVEALKPYITQVKKEPAKEVAPNPVAPPLEAFMPPQEVVPQRTELASKPAPKAAPKSAKYIFVSLPTRAEETLPAAVAKSVAPQEPIEIEGADEETPEQKLERKALEIRQRAQAYAEGKKKEAEEPSLDTKYTRSLEDIKEEYSHWMYEQKTKSTKPSLSKKQGLVVASLVVLAGVFYLSAKWMNTPVVESTQAINALPHNPAPVAVSKTVSQPAEVKQSVINTDVYNDNSKMLQELERANKEIEKDLERYADKKPVRSVAIDEPMASQHEDTDESFSYEPSYDATPSPSTEKTHTSREPVAKPASYPVTKKGEVKSLPLNQLIDVQAKYIGQKSTKGLAGLQLTLQNNSSQLLKTVAVDVFYYREDNHLLDKETVYFSNVQPNESLTLTAPGHRKASSATYQLGLISSDGGLYVAKQ